HSGKLDIPQEILERAKLSPADEGEIELSSGGGVYVRPIPTPFARMSGNGGQAASRLEQEGSVLVVSGLKFDGSWDELFGAFRQEQINRSAGVQSEKDAR